MESISCKSYPKVIQLIADNWVNCACAKEAVMKKGKLLLIAGITTAFMLVANDNADAQTLASSSPTKTEKPSKTSANKLNAPVVKAHQGDGAAMKGSWDGHIAVHIYRAKDDPISGERYAKGMAKAFSTPEKSGGKPINIIATYQESNYAPKSYVNIYIDGVTWKYDGSDNLTPNLARHLIPQIMKDYVAEFGDSKLIPEEGPAVATVSASL